MITRALIQELGGGKLGLEERGLAQELTTRGIRVEYFTAKLLSRERARLDRHTLVAGTVNVVSAALRQLNVPVRGSHLRAMGRTDADGEPGGGRPMKLYEVVRWGNDSDDADDGGPNGPDTCFLVRAAGPEEAARLVDAELEAAAPVRVPPRADVVHLLGDSLSTETEPRILRGPYVEHAFNRGWKVWLRERDGDGDEWIEWKDCEAAATE